MSYIIHCLVRRLEGAVFMIITRQVIGCVFRTTKSTKNAQTKTAISLSRCLNFLLFFGTLLFFNQSSLWQTICDSHTLLFYTRPPLVTAHSTVTIGAKVADKKFPLRPLVFKTQLYYFANTSLFITPPFERVHKHKCCIIYPIIRRMSILWWEQVQLEVTSQSQS